MSRKVRLSGEAMEERDALRKLLKWRSALADYVSGYRSEYVPPLTVDANALLSRLGKKYKYDPEFRDKL